MNESRHHKLSSENLASCTRYVKNVKIYLKLSPVHAMVAYRGAEVYSTTQFLSVALVGGMWSDSYPG
jgi:hypothetical protein